MKLVAVFFLVAISSVLAENGKPVLCVFMFTEYLIMFYLGHLSLCFGSVHHLPISLGNLTNKNQTLCDNFPPVFQ